MSWQEEMEVFARERGPALVGYAHLLTGDVHGARDLVQEAFVRTFSRRRSGWEIDRLEAYTRRTVVNLYLDDYRRRRAWLDRRHLVPAPSSPPTPESVTATADLDAALARLTPRQRACVVLRYVEDLSVGDVANALGLSDGAVKRYLFDARARLGAELDDGEELSVETAAGPQRGGHR